MREKSIFVILFLSMAALCCQIEFTSQDSTYQPPTPEGCPLPPEGFSESDLIGTWFGFSLFTTDTLIIRNDGKYKQIIHLDNPSFDFESDWQPWWLEYTESGTPYLHLEGMRLCAADSEVECEPPGGGRDIWHSVCDDRSGLLINEGILAIVGTQEGFDVPLRGIRLILYERWPFSAMGYTLLEP